MTQETTESYFRQALLRHIFEIGHAKYKTSGEHAMPSSIDGFIDGLFGDKALKEARTVTIKAVESTPENPTDRTSYHVDHNGFYASRANKGGIFFAQLSTPIATANGISLKMRRDPATVISIYADMEGNTHPFDSGHCLFSMMADHGPRQTTIRQAFVNASAGEISLSHFNPANISGQANLERTLLLGAAYASQILEDDPDFSPVDTLASMSTKTISDADITKRFAEQYGHLRR